MRTTIDIPDAMLQRVRRRLRSQGRTLREAVIEGLRLTVLAQDDEAGRRFQLRDAAFTGRMGFAPGFGSEDLGTAIRSDAEQRLAAEPGAGYEA